MPWFSFFTSSEQAALVTFGIEGHNFFFNYFANWEDFHYSVVGEESFLSSSWNFAAPQEYPETEVHMRRESRVPWKRRLCSRPDVGHKSLKQCLSSQHGRLEAQRCCTSCAPPRQQIQHEAPICVILFPIASLTNECHKYQADQETNYLLY
jgi:hypothetical protein